MRLNHNKKLTFAASPPLFGDIGHRQPKFGCRPDGVKEGIELHRFPQVAIRVQEIGIPNVPFRVRGRQYGDRDNAEVLVLLDRSKNRSGIGFWQVEVEENEAGPGSFLVGRSLPEERKRLFAVRSDSYIDGGIQAAESLSDKPHIARIILHN